MASISPPDTSIVLVCTDPYSVDANATEEFSISTTDIHRWDLPQILRHKTVKVRVLRNRLVEESTYFHGLLSGSFSESCLDCISVEWNLDIFLSILKFMYSSQLDVTSENFLLLFEAALYFGVDTLLLKCKTWLSEVTSPKRSPPIEIALNDLIHIWNFGLEHAVDFVPELCTGYLARNFMWAVSSKFFGDVPYDLLLSCVQRPDLTVDSEMHLSDALLLWLDVNTTWSECSSNSKDEYDTIIKQIHGGLLPLWFVAGRRTSPHISKLADESILLILRLIRNPFAESINLLEDGDLNHLRIRLSNYSKKLDLSGCPQMKSEILFLSLLPSTYDSNPTLKNRAKQCLISLDRLNKDQRQVFQRLMPILSFEAVQEVNISKCSGLNLESAIEIFSSSFPSLRILKAKYLLNFKNSSLLKLVQKCPSVTEVDLTVDITPVIPSQVSVVSSSPAITQPRSMRSVTTTADCNVFDIGSLYPLGPVLSNISKLTLEGRSDIRDSDLEYISRSTITLQYLNVKGCISITDVGISKVIRSCPKLHSIVVCDTSFGTNSVLALCSCISMNGDPSSHDAAKSNSFASNLQILHIGGCQCADEASLLKLISQTSKLKSLCLRDTHLVDATLCSFSGSSLEVLDVSNTMVSGDAVAHIVHRNLGLKSLKMRGCSNVFHQESESEGTSLSSLYICSELFGELGKTCILEEVEMGWGFTWLSLEAMRPAIMSLRAITVGIGGSLGEGALDLLPLACPLLEFIILYFQVVSDTILTNIIVSLKQLKVLGLCYCLGDISISSFKFLAPNLRKLKLERVTPWMKNDDLFLLTQNFSNLLELSLVGCTLLNSDSEHLISSGWPGLISLRLEECGQVTASGVSSLFDCLALEDLLLRHNGCGIQKKFILDAILKMPMLRRISLDLCDAKEADFDVPDYKDGGFLSSIKIARCKRPRCALFQQEVHKETLVLEWTTTNLIRTVVKERL